MPENPYQPPKEVNEASDVRFPALWHTLRFLLPATGAFLLGEYPGMYLLMRFIATRRHWTSGAETIFLVVLLASFGASIGLAVFRLTSRTKSDDSDAIVIGGLTVAASLMGCAVLVYLGA